MVNWWLRITTPTNLYVKQIALYDVPVNPADYFYETTPVKGEGLVLNNPSVRVTGHSLGGALATSFARIFEGALTADVTTREFLNTQFGARTPLSQENSANVVGNHFMYKLTDLLALGNMLSTLDESLDFTTLNKIVDAGSNKTEASYESVLDAFRKMVGIYKEPTPIGDVADSADSRVAYYKNLDELTAALTTGNLKSLVNNVLIVTQDAYTQAGQTDYGQFLALYFLTPFALSGKETDLKNLNPDLYDLWSADKNLSAEERNNGTANFSVSKVGNNSNNALCATAKIYHTKNKKYFQKNKKSAYKSFSFSVMLGAEQINAIHTTRLTTGLDNRALQAA